MVAPPIVPLPHIHIAPGGRSGAGRPRTNAPERSVSASNVRAYVPGDDLRLLHWRTTARHAAPYVRVLDGTPSGDWWIILDLDRQVQLGQGQDSSLERGILLAASLADRGLRQGRAVGLAASGDHLVWLATRAGENYRWEILRALALANPGDLVLGSLLANSPQAFGQWPSLVLITMLDLQQIKNIYLKSIKLIALLSFPILSTIMIRSELIINGIYGEKWSGAIRVLQILSIAGSFRVITNSAGAVAKATGKVYEEAWRQLIFALILIVGALIGIKYGIEGVGFAVVISSLWFYLSMAHLTIKIVNITWSDFFKVQIPGFLVFIIITIVNLATIITLNYFLGLEMHLFKLLILFLISSMALLVLLKTLPVKLIGEDGRNLITLYFEKLKSLSKRGIEYVDFF